MVSGEHCIIRGTGGNYHACHHGPVCAFPEFKPMLSVIS